MGMKLFFSGLAVIAGLSLMSNMSTPQDEKDAAKKMQEDMAKMKAAAAPGEQHTNLAKLVGTWDQKFVKVGTNITGTGTVTYRPILGGRFIVGETTATMKAGADGMNGDGASDMPWEGFCILGYNNVDEAVRADPPRLDGDRHLLRDRDRGRLGEDDHLRDDDQGRDHAAGASVQGRGPHRERRQAGRRALGGA